MNDSERVAAIEQIAKVIKSRTSKLKRADLASLMVLAVGEQWLHCMEDNKFGQIDFDGGSSIAIQMGREVVDGVALCRAFWKIHNCRDWGDIERLAKFKAVWQAMGPVYLDEPVPYDYSAAWRSATPERGFGKGGPDDTRGT